MAVWGIQVSRGFNSVQILAVDHVFFSMFSKA